ncbi:MAG: PilZ domain-containing protein [Deltaproteobacteria bacterium]|jgi:type IV pilus assembly protein PilZ|nr:PilZ domain-containing protein [Deltaproteobacteria bacterium]MBW2534693.1 PilZ domain-containing protein [Deltaproteobacteria bacterium]
MRGKSNQRRHVRKDVDFPVLVLVDGVPAVDGRCANLSVGGMFVEEIEPIVVGEQVSVRFKLTPDARSMELPATVRWTKRKGMGLQFGTVNATQTYELTEFLAGSAPELTPPPPPQADAPKREDRRRQPRVDLFAQVWVRFAPGDLLVQLQNISLSGALLVLGEVDRPRWVDVDRAVELAITNPESMENVVVLSRIVRVQRDERGISFAVVFTSVDDVARRGLEDLIQLGTPQPERA